MPDDGLGYEGGAEGMSGEAVFEGGTDGAAGGGGDADGYEEALVVEVCLVCRRGVVSRFGRNIDVERPVKGADGCLP